MRWMRKQTSSLRRALRLPWLSKSKNTSTRSKLKSEGERMKSANQQQNSEVGLFSPDVRCSLDPQKDFKDSMMEMIAENRIDKPEKLEELLALYLTLNSNEFHDLIIEAFRQVWLELKLS